MNIKNAKTTWRHSFDLYHFLLLIVKSERSIVTAVWVGGTFKELSKFFYRIIQHEVVCALICTYSVEIRSVIFTALHSNKMLIKPIPWSKCTCPVPLLQAHSTLMILKYINSANCNLGLKNPFFSRY